MIFIGLAGQIFRLVEDNYKIVCATYRDGEIYLDEVLGEDKLKSILPMFVKDL